MPSRPISGIAAAALAAGILYLGVPRAIGGIFKLPGDHVVAELRADQSIDAAEVAALMASRERTLAWFQDRKVWGELGLARLMAAVALPPDDETRQPTLSGAVEAIEQGLALAPNDGYAWARLAIARYYSEGPGQRVADAVGQSLLIVDWDLRLIRDRLDVALAVWDWLPPESRVLVRRQIGYAYDISPRALADLARTPDRRVRIIAGLSDTPERMMKLERYLRMVRR
jgi:hypothetical protein